MAEPINSSSPRTNTELQAEHDRQFQEQLDSRFDNLGSQRQTVDAAGNISVELDPIVIRLNTEPDAQDFGFGNGVLGNETFGTSQSQSVATFGLAGEAQDLPAPDFTPIQPTFGAVSFDEVQQGPDFAPVGGGSQVPGFDGQVVGGAVSPDFTGVGTGSQVPGERAVTGPTEQIGPDFTGVGTGSQVGGAEAVTEGDQIGPNFSNPTGTGPEQPGGGGLSPQDVQAVSSARQTVTRPNSPDWRFRIGLMPGSDVLYRDGDSSSILSPLLRTDGVVFPYTPNVLVNYRANYDKISPTHTNFPSYYYQSSEVSDVQINATFTAQSTDEADYMMAMIHFFRSATKMFYGQDPNRGQPPPLVSVTGFGQHQFNFHKAVVSQFNYSLPDNVDYVRTSAGGVGSIQAQSTRAQLSGGQGNFGVFGIASRIGRLLGIGSDIGAEGPGAGFKAANEGTNLAKANSSYVPTKIEVSLILLPVVTRAEQSKVYSTKDYANGVGLSQRGHW